MNTAKKSHTKKGGYSTTKSHKKTKAKPKQQSKSQYPKKTSSKNSAKNVSHTQPKKKGNNMSQSTKPIKGKNSLENPDIPHENEKTQIVARNLLRLYNFLAKDKPLEQTNLLKEIDLGTPNEELNNKIEELTLELEAVYEENQALRQSALQNQVEREEEISTYKIEIEDLHNQIDQVDIDVKIKTQELIEKYEQRITKLEKNLQESVVQNEKITQVNEAVQLLQDKTKSLFYENDRLEKETRKLSAHIKDQEQENKKLKTEIEDFISKKEELDKKIALQNMVIEGFKRKEKQKTN